MQSSESKTHSDSVGRKQASSLPIRVEHLLTLEQCTVYLGPSVTVNFDKNNTLTMLMQYMRTFITKCIHQLQ